MNLQTWDPLLVSKDADSEIISAAQKREIKNILKSYVGMYDSFSELIQNAMDAVDKRSAIEGGRNIRNVYGSLLISRKTRFQ